jgi:hypothetical protein
MASALTNRTEQPYHGVPPLRPDPFEVDAEHDKARVIYVHSLWDDQNDLLRDRDRQIEKNVRMICGNQWSVWSSLLGQYMDLRDYLSDEERRWRIFPVINRMLHWYMLLHARMTENPPVITFQPMSGDHLDAELSEVMDTVWKFLWQDTGMAEKVDDLFAWLIPGGRAYLKSRIDPLAGEPREFRKPAALTLLDSNGDPIYNDAGEAVQRPFQDVPFDENGEPVVLEFLEDGGVRFGEAHTDYEGAIVVDVLSPLQVRGAWGPTPWAEKRWHMQKTLMTPEEVYDAFGVVSKTALRGDRAESAGLMRRMMLGAGFFGSAGGRRGPMSSHAEMVREGYVEIYEVWFRESRFPGTERTRESPGGRLLVVAGDVVVYDGPRWARFKYTSPMRHFDFVNVPGRPSGTSPAEMLVGPQSTYNRVAGQILQHSTIAGNPTRVVDTNSGIQEDQITNKPGLTLFANLQQSPNPITYVRPPDLTNDVWQALAHLRKEMNELGNIAGAEGTPPTSDASGELVKELRFNSDRFVGPTMRRAVMEFTRMAEDWQCMLPLIWDESKIIRVAGEDSIATTVTVLPHLFEKGRVHVRPDVESMLPEGRGERQFRIERHYGLGLYGQPGSPEAINRFFELGKFPHMGRESRPGGMDRVMAEQNVGKLLQGSAAPEIPVFEWYDYATHLAVTERFMKSPEFLKVPVRIMQQFVFYRETLLAAQQQFVIQEQMELNNMNAASAGHAQLAAQAAGLPMEQQEAPPNRPARQEVSAA